MIYLFNKKLFLIALVIFVSFGFGAKAEAATAYVQGKGQTNVVSSNSVTTSFTGNVVAGNTIAALIAWVSTTGTLNSVTATCVTGNLTLVDNPTTGIGARIAMAYGVINTSGSCSITATFSTSQANNTLLLNEISGVDINSPLDVSRATVSSFGTAANSGNIVTNYNGGFIFGGSFNTASATYTAGGSFGNLITAARYGIENQVQTTAGTIAATFTGSGSTYHYAGVMALKPDITAPVITDFTIPSTASSLTASISSLTVDNTLGVKYLLNESATTPAIDDVGWSSTAPTEYTFASGGAKTLYAWAKDGAGNISSSANDTITITVDTDDPIVPTNPSATAISTSRIDLSWTASTDSGGSGLTGYKIYRCEGVGCTPTTLLTTNVSTSYSNTGLTTNTTYRYAISAYDGAGNESATTTASGTATFALPGSYIDSARRIDWSNSGIPGGIPSRTTICATIDAATYGNGSSDATAGIQSALNSCPANQVVSLSAGTFRIDSNLVVPDQVVLRGAGPQQTILDAHGTSGRVITLGTYVTPLTANSVAITAGTSAGSNSITVADATGITVGSRLIITELNDSSFVTSTGEGGNCTWCDSWSGTRAAGQIVEVTSVDGTSIGITPSLYKTYSDLLSPLASRFTSGGTYIGVEDLQVYANDTGYTTNFGMSGVAYSWIKNVESNYTDGDHVQAYYSYRGEIRDSYFHDAFNHTPGSTDADVFIAHKTSGFLVENNILRRLHASIMLNWGAAGNVIAYNYSDGAFDQTATNVLMGDISIHAAHPWFNLFEGNIAASFHPDSYWGSNSHNTVFRNWFKGTTQMCEPKASGVRGAETSTCNWAVQALKAVAVDYLGRYFNFVGNVIGSPEYLTLTKYNLGVTPITTVPFIVAPTTRSYDSVAYGYTFGYGISADDGSDPDDSDLPYTTAFIHGDYNIIDSSTTWDSGTADHTIPSSLYLYSKPSWFGVLDWPAVGPDISGFTNNNPASYCYTQGQMPNCLESEESGDISAPTVTAFTIPSTASSLTVNITTYTATDNTAVTGYLINESSDTPSVDDADWSVSAPTTYTFSSVGTKTLYAWAKDAVGNISVSANDTVVITLTSETPATPAPSGGGNGPIYGSTRHNISTLIATTTPPCTTITPSIILIRNLSRGSLGSDVTTLQNFLLSKNFLTSDSITGYFGPLTETAVKAFQSSVGIVSSGTPQTTGYGNVGALTRAKITAMSTTTCTPNQATTTPSPIFTFTRNLSLNMTGEDVRSLQKLLNSLGFTISQSGAGSAGKETALFGSLTYKALVKFQASVGLPATGFFGPMTREYVNKK